MQTLVYKSCMCDGNALCVHARILSSGYKCGLVLGCGCPSLTDSIELNALLWINELSHSEWPLASLGLFYVLCADEPYVTLLSGLKCTALLVCVCVQCIHACWRRPVALICHALLCSPLICCPLLCFALQSRVARALFPFTQQESNAWRCFDLRCASFLFRSCAMQCVDASRPAFLRVALRCAYQLTMRRS